MRSSCIAFYLLPMGLSKHSVFFLQGMWFYMLKYETYSFNGLQGDVAQYAANQTRNIGANPFSLR